MEKFIKLKAYANSSQFSSDLKSIAILIDNNIIDLNYLNKFPYIKNVIGDLIKNSNINERLVHIKIKIKSIKKDLSL